MNNTNFPNTLLSPIKFYNDSETSVNNLKSAEDSSIIIIEKVEEKEEMKFG